MEIRRRGVPLGRKKKLHLDRAVDGGGGRFKGVHGIFHPKHCVVFESPPLGMALDPFALPGWVDVEEDPLWEWQLLLLLLLSIPRDDEGTVDIHMMILQPDKLILNSLTLSFVRRLDFDLQQQQPGPSSF